MFNAMKSAGFNIDDTHLADLHRIEKLLLLVMVAFVWCYNVGELVRQKYNPIRILKQLKDEDLIEYVGSKKTGGYRVTRIFSSPNLPQTQATENTTTRKSN